ncbi:MAG: hypothetical protein H5T97_00035 [Firmicutes bacterium]|nr:hypothetical protein [Bacillota bacterium]
MGRKGEAFGVYFADLFSLLRTIARLGTAPYDKRADGGDRESPSRNRRAPHGHQP